MNQATGPSAGPAGPATPPAQSASTRLAKGFWLSPFALGTAAGDLARPVARLTQMTGRPRLGVLLNDLRPDHASLEKKAEPPGFRIPGLQRIGTLSSGVGFTSSR